MNTRILPCDSCVERQLIQTIAKEMATEEALHEEYEISGVSAERNRIWRGSKRALVHWLGEVNHILTMIISAQAHPVYVVGTWFTRFGDSALQQRSARRENVAC